MAPRTRRMLLLSILLICFYTTGLSHAASGENITFTPDCRGFTSGGGAVTTNRDNTGRSREAIVITAFDGGGRTLYENTSIYPLDQRITFEDGARLNYTALPHYNPITLKIVSVSGNGESEQLLFMVSGSCPGLPTFGGGLFVIGDDLALLPLAVLQAQAATGGRAEPAADPNAAPPRPQNPAGTAEAQPGYAIVNTDNLFLRSGDSPAYTPVGILDGGTRLVVIGSNGRLRAPESLWWYVEIGGLRGWVKDEFLILRGDLRGLPVMPVEGQFITPTLYVSLDNPLYSSRAIGGGLLCLIPGGQLYNVIAADGTTPAWYLIEADCDHRRVNGWIPADRGLLRNPSGRPVPIIR